MNGDGRPDLVVTGYNTVTSGVGVLLNNNGAPPTTTSLVLSINPVTVNQMVTYTATVKPQSGRTVKGTVLFQDGSIYPGFPVPLGEVPLEANQAELSLSYSIGIVLALRGRFRGRFLLDNSQVQG